MDVVEEDMVETDVVVVVVVMETDNVEVVVVMVEDMVEVVVVVDMEETDAEAVEDMGEVVMVVVEDMVAVVMVEAVMVEEAMAVVVDVIVIVTMVVVEAGMEAAVAAVVVVDEIGTKKPVQCNVFHNVMYTAYLPTPLNSLFSTFTASRWKRIMEMLFYCYRQYLQKVSGKLDVEQYREINWRENILD